MVAPFCDAVFATVVASPRGVVAILYWARSAHYGVPLQMVEWSSTQFTHHSWVSCSDRLAELAAISRARFGSIGAFIEGDELTQQAQADGLSAQSIPAYLTTKDYWPRLGVSAAGHIRRGEVKIAGTAVDRSVRPSFSPLNYAGEERVNDDPTIAAFLYGIVLSLDESAAQDPADI